MRTQPVRKSPRVLGPTLSISIAVAVATAVLAATTPPTRTAAPAYPPPPGPGVTEVLHGISVADPYRALEDLDSAPTRAWIDAQDALTRGLLDGDADFDRLRRRIEELTKVESFGVPVARGERLFYLHVEADSNRPSAYVAALDGGSPRAVVDGDALPEPERLRGLWPSPDGTVLAYGVGDPAARRFEVRFLHVASGRRLPDALAGLSAVGGGPVWTRDGRVVFYGRYAEPAAGATSTAALGDYRLFSHRLGSAPEDDPVVLALPEEPSWTLAPAVTLDGRFLVVTASEGSGPLTRLFVQDLAGSAPPRPLLPEVSAAATAFLDAQGESFWILTTHGAPRGRVVRVELGRTAPAAWTEVLPEGEDTLYFANVVADRLIAVYVRDARHLVKVFDLDGRFEREVALPDLGTTFSGFVGRRDDRHAFYSFTGIAYPGSASVFRLDPRSGESAPFFAPRLGFDPGDYVTKQVFFHSKDGTRVPMFVAHRRDVSPDGTHPAYLYAYGAFAWAATPWFQPHVLAWMERGGVYALANVRGGGEYGESWHQAGIGARRQNAVDDYLAAAEWLVANRYAAPGRLVANGGSASGPLAATAIVQRPELFGAAAIDIPVVDLVRYERFTGGARWRSELGSADDPVELRRLLAQSPLHNLQPGACYPPTLVTAGEKDDVAVPSHAYKLTAALQAAQGCDRPILLQVVRGGGHGYGTTREQSAETYARQLRFLEQVLARRIPAGAS